MGTVAGVLICIIISYLKDLLHLTSNLTTIFVTELFQLLWFFIVSFLIYLRSDDISYIVGKFWRFLPEGIIVSLLAPFFFSIFDVIWKPGHENSLGTDV